MLQRKIASYGDPRLFALTFASRELAHSTQPLVPERLFMTSNGGESAGSPGDQGLLGTLLGLLVADRAGFAPVSGIDQSDLKELAEQLTRDSLEVLRESTTKVDVPEATAS